MVVLTVNGVRHELDVAPDTPLLWVVRDHLGLTGSKFGCGMGLCGACTMHVDGTAMRTCTMPVSAIAGKDVRTVEDLGGDHPVQQAWLAEQVPQCGYCQSGQIMSACALLASIRAPSDAEIAAGMTNICRCGTYDRIRKAVKRAGAAMGPLPAPEPPAAPAESPAGEDQP
jgi:isoquinoline 1-oxidoreductase alpha subunit